MFEHVFACLRVCLCVFVLTSSVPMAAVIFLIVIIVVLLLVLMLLLYVGQIACCKRIPGFLCFSDPAKKKIKPEDVDADDSDDEIQEILEQSMANKTPTKTSAAKSLVSHESIRLDTTDRAGGEDDEAEAIVNGQLHCRVKLEQQQQQQHHQQDTVTIRVHFDSVRGLRLVGDQQQQSFSHYQIGAQLWLPWSSVTGRKLHALSPKEMATVIKSGKKSTGAGPVPEVSEHDLEEGYTATTQPDSASRGLMGAAANENLRNVPRWSSKPIRSLDSEQAMQGVGEISLDISGTTVGSQFVYRHVTRDELEQCNLRVRVYGCGGRGGSRRVQLVAEAYLALGDTLMHDNIGSIGSGQWKPISIGLETRFRQHKLNKEEEEYDVPEIQGGNIISEQHHQQQQQQATGRDGVAGTVTGIIRRLVDVDVALPDCSLAASSSQNPACLLIGLTYKVQLGIFQLDIIRAANLVFPLNSYVKFVICEGGTKHGQHDSAASSSQQLARGRTSIRLKSANPTYLESFQFQLAQFQMNDASLLLALYHKRPVITNTATVRKQKILIGYVKLTSGENISHASRNLWNEMRSSKGQPVNAWLFLERS